MGAAISSGSFQTDGMIVAPCSAKTLGAIANGFGDNLVHRAADVTLKERRRLVLALREAPLSDIHLENMLKLSRMGAIVMPPVPAFYTLPQSVDDIVNHTVARLLDLFGVDVKGAARWTGEMNVRSAHSVANRQLRLALLERALGVVHGLRGVGGVAGGAARRLARRVGGRRGLLQRRLGLLLLALRFLQTRGGGLHRGFGLGGVAARRGQRAFRLLDRAPGGRGLRAFALAAALRRCRDRRPSPRPADGWTRTTAPCWCRRRRVPDRCPIWAPGRPGHRSPGLPRRPSAARARAVGSGVPCRQSLQVQGHATEHVRAWRVPVARQKHRGLARQLVQGLTLGLQGIVDVDGLAREARRPAPA